jgi:hypothetical protein
MAAVIIHPFLLARPNPSCAFCGSTYPFKAYPLAEEPTKGWFACEKEECLKHLLFCQQEHTRRLAKNHLGNSREPIRYFSDSDSDF